MLYGIGVLCDHLQTKYDFVCRWRNDLFLKDDLKIWINILENDQIDYVYPILLWMFNDGCNDHFGIAKQNNFMKIWANTHRQLKLIFSEWKNTPETYILKRLQINQMSSAFIIPEYLSIHKEKHEFLLLENGTVNPEKLNSYMKNYMKKLLLTFNKYQLNPIYSLKCQIIEKII
jgi:hypothetical protein